MKSTNLIIVFVAILFIGCSGSEKTKESVSARALPTPVSETKNKLPYKIVNNQFYVNNELIPPGCIAQLMTELNGDNVQATIYLERNSLRGCLTANLTYTSGNPDDISYVINKQLPDDVYNITVTQTIDGSLDESNDKIVVQFIEKPYLLANGDKKMVLSLDKIGDWEN